MTETTLEKKAAFVNDHLEYPDIMPHGIEEYPFVESRINPIFYEIPEGAKVLDVGCNSGEFMKLLKDKKKCDVYGVDISQQVVDLCKEKGLNVQLTDADKLPFPDASFDVVTLMEVLEHFHNPVPYLKEIRRVLKPKGFLLGSCPHANLERYIWADDRKHHQYYDEPGIRKDLDQAFQKTHLIILDGAQFNVAFATTFLATEPCEILFKSGGKKLQPWEEQRNKTEDVRAWFGPTQTEGTVYFRMWGFLKKMEKNKWGVEPGYERCQPDGSDHQNKWQFKLRVADDNGGSRWSKFLLDNFFTPILKVSDMSVWQLVQSQEALALLMTAKHGLKKQVITDVDDWIFDLPAYNIASGPYHPSSLFEELAFNQLKLSDALIVSTQYLIDHLKEFFPGKPMHLIPNGVDFDIWDHLEPIERPEYAKEKDVIRIGYTGCANHGGDLELIKRPVLKLLEEFPNLDVMMTNQRTNDWAALKHPRIKQAPWAFIDVYPHEIAGWKMDIGVAPLMDNHFNRAKSNLRWLEYSALKVPTVASDVEPFRRSVSHGTNGILCRSEVEWYEALKGLIVEEGKRIALGNQAYKTVKKNFDMEKIAKRYAGILKELKCSGVKLKKRLVAS